MFIADCNDVEKFLPIIQSFYQKINYSPSKEIILFRGQNSDEPLLPKYAHTIISLFDDDAITGEEVLSVEKERFLEVNAIILLFLSSEGVYSPITFKPALLRFAFTFSVTSSIPSEDFAPRIYGLKYAALLIL